jgi:hypothetical protein
MVEERQCLIAERAGKPHLSKDEIARSWDLYAADAPPKARQ